MLVLHRIYAFFIRLFCLIIFPKALSKRVRNFLLEFYFFRSVYSFFKLFTKEIRKNSILVYEPNNSHTEVVFGYVKYLLELGYNVDLILAPNVKKWKVFQEIEWKDVRLYYFSIYFTNLINKFINKYKAVLFTSVSVYRYDNTTINILNLFPKNLDKNKILVVEHELKDLEKNNLLELEKEGRVITLGNFNKGIQVNPHYFCKTSPHIKNEITKFICVGSVDKKRKNHNLLFSAVKKLKSINKNFIVYIISGRTLKGIPEDLKSYIKFCGRLDFPAMYKLMQEIDFYLPLLDPENPLHERYITTGVTGSAQLIYGFTKPPVIHKKFASFYSFNNNNSIIYDEDIFDGMLKAISMNGNEYINFRNNLKQLADDIKLKSINNLNDAYMLDSDVLVYDDLKNLNTLISKYDFAVSVKNFEDKNKEPGDWIAGPPLGYFKIDILKKMCDFFTASYSNKKYLSLFDEKMKYHETRGEKFGICDMTQIYFFVKENLDNFFNFSSIFKINDEDTTIDLSILDTDNFVSENSHKKFIFKDDGVFAIPKTNKDKIIRFSLIHFQGYNPINAKKWIPLYYHGGGYLFRITFTKLKIKIKLFKYLIQKILFILLRCKIKGKNNKINFPLKIKSIRKLKIKVEGNNNIIDLSNISYVKRFSKITVEGDYNILTCSSMQVEGNLYLQTKGDNIAFKCGKNVKIDDSLFCYLQDNTSVIIGEKTSFFKTSIQSIHSGTSVIIGKNCMFSYDTWLYNSDGHPIVDKDDKIINIPGNLELGDNVWVSWSAAILKGVKIPNNCIVGRSAIVTKSFDKERAVIAGNPAKICKIFEEGTNWMREHKEFLKTH